MEKIIVKNVIFDLYGTLLDIHTDEDQLDLWAKMVHFYGMSGAFYTAETLREQYQREVSIRFQHEEGDIEILEVFDALFKQKDVVVSQEKLIETARLFRILSLEYVKPYPHALDLLKVLRSRGYKVILLSNAQRAFTMDELKVTDLLNRFDHVYLSSDYGVAKPSKVFYQTMLEKEGLSAEACIFIGNDHRTDIEGANRVGMYSIYLHTNCSPQEVPAEIGCTFRIDSGNLKEVIDLFDTEIQFG